MTALPHGRNIWSDRWKDQERRAKTGRTNVRSFVRSFVATIRQLALLVVGVVVGVLIAKSLAEPTTPPPRPDARPDRVEIDLANLRSEVRALRHDEALPVASVDGGTELLTVSLEREEAAGDSEHLSPEEAEAQALARAEARAEVIEVAMGTRPRSTFAERRVTALVAGYQPRHGRPPTLESIRCTDEICRIEMRHREPNAAHQMQLSMMGQPGLNGEGLMIRREDAEGYVTSYYVTQGDVPLPRQASP